MHKPIAWIDQQFKAMGRRDARDLAFALLASYEGTCAHCIDGQAGGANRRITDALGTQDAQPEFEPGDEGEGDSEQAS